MPAQIHTLHLGALTCHIIGDGESPRSIEGLQRNFASVDPQAIADAAQAPQHASQIHNSFNCLLLQHGDQKLLVDVGMPGEHFGHLAEGLAALDIAPESIQQVMITHMHGDHFLGLVDADGAPQYPNAQIIMNAVEWDYWSSETTLNTLAEEHAAQLRRFQTLIRPHLKTLSAGEDILPGVRLLALYGHSPGHSGLWIEFGEKRLLALVDTLHVIFQFTHPDWTIGFDSVPEQSRATRAEWLAHAADDNQLCVFYHLPFPGLGYVRREGQHYRWEPLD